jgi:hypothetical protein
VLCTSGGRQPCCWSGGVVHAAVGGCWPLPQFWWRVARTCSAVGCSLPPKDRTDALHVNRCKVLGCPCLDHRRVVTP